jgi:hypothetical protein
MTMVPVPAKIPASHRGLQKIYFWMSGRQRAVITVRRAPGRSRDLARRRALAAMVSNILNPVSNVITLRKA